MEHFHYKARIRLTGSLHPGNEKIRGKEVVIEVSELTYGTEIVNRKKKPSFHLKTNMNQMKLEHNRLKIS